MFANCLTTGCAWRKQMKVTWRKLIVALALSASSVACEQTEQQGAKQPERQGTGHAQPYTKKRTYQKHPPLLTPVIETAERPISPCQVSRPCCLVSLTYFKSASS